MTRPSPTQTGGSGGEVEAARETIRDALMDSQYLAGAQAGWNAAQADDPEAAFKALQESRSGHLSGYREAKAALAATPNPIEPRAGVGLTEREFVKRLSDALSAAYRREGGIAKLARQTNGAMTIRNIATLEAAAIYRSIVAEKPSA